MSDINVRISMCEIGDLIYDYMKEFKYVFAVLGHSVDVLNTIKEIMYERKLTSCIGEITLYAPYKELFEAHEALYGADKLWGIGFKLSALKEKAKWMGAQQTNPDNQSYKGLSSCKVMADMLDFTGLDRNSDEVFFVVPKIGDWRKVWSNGYKKGMKYEQWWCQGLHKGSCSVTRSDNDLEKYLARKKRPFRWNNYEMITQTDLFPQRNTLEGIAEMKTGYTLLNLSPQELNSGSRKEADVTGQTLF